MLTLQLEEGDLVFNSGTFEQVQSRAKLVQDLSYALKEELGVDRFHPRWGSLLPSYIGQPANDRTALLIEGEVRRIIQNAMAVQKDNILRDAAKGDRTRYGTGEVVRTISAIQVRQEYDLFHVRIALDTLSNEEIVIISTVRG